MLDFLDERCIDLVVIFHGGEVHHCSNAVVSCDLWWWIMEGKEAGRKVEKGKRLVYGGQHRHHMMGSSFDYSLHTVIGGVG